MYQFVLVCTNKDLVSKMLKTRFERAIFCMILACFTAALQEYRNQTPYM